VKALHEARQQYRFKLVGYVIMPEHVHLLISEPMRGTPSTVMQVLKQRVSRLMRAHWNRAPKSQMHLWNEDERERPRRFWQRRFYDFNVWSRKKKIEKLAICT
jgi:putative transposase